MMAREALQKCPHLLAAPYEFDKYESVSDEIYKIFARAVGFESGRIEAVSCDEAYLDLTGLELPAIDDSNTQPSPSLSQPSWDMDRKAWGSAWAAKIRSEVATATGCPVSAGLGPNKLLARLATAEAKPDGQRVLLDPAEVDDHLRSLAVSKLPGLGWQGQRKLKEKLDHAAGHDPVQRERIHEKLHKAMERLEDADDSAKLETRSLDKLIRKLRRPNAFSEDGDGDSFLEESKVRTLWKN